MANRIASLAAVCVVISSVLHLAQAATYIGCVELLAWPVKARRTLTR
jgi:hypothetical protein